MGYGTTGFARLAAVRGSLAIVAGYAGRDSLLVEDRRLNCQANETLVCRGNSATNIKAYNRTNSANSRCASKVW